MTDYSYMDTFSFYDGLKEGSRILCPRCGKDSPFEQWEEAEVNCGVCGGHLAIQCPNCKARLDSVHEDKNLKLI